MHIHVCIQSFVCRICPLRGIEVALLFYFFKIFFIDYGRKKCGCVCVGGTQLHGALALSRSP